MNEDDGSTRATSSDPIPTYTKLGYGLAGVGLIGALCGFAYVTHPGEDSTTASPRPTVTTTQTVTQPPTTVTVTAAAPSASSGSASSASPSPSKSASSPTPRESPSDSPTIPSSIASPYRDYVHVNKDGSKNYSIQKGDSLSKIAAGTGSSLNDLIKRNMPPIVNPNLIYPGNTVKLP